MADPESGAWLGPDERPAFADFWQVFVEQYDAIAAEMLPDVARREPAFADPERAAQARRDARAGMAEISDALETGNWIPVEATLEERGARFARLGSSLGAWTDIVLRTKGHTVPRLVQAYGADPGRLSKALCAMETFWDRCVRVASRRYYEDREALLRRSEMRFARLMASGIVGVVFSGFDGRIRDANEAFLSMVKYSRSDLEAGLSWLELTPPEYREQSEQIGQSLMRSGVSMPVEKEYICKDGSRAAVIVGAAGLEQSESIGFVLDITERKRLAEQLRHTQKMEAIGSLAGGVAHDFNNLLSVILGYSEILLAGLPPESPLFVDLHEIHRAGERAAALTRQLLAFSRKQRLNPEVVNLNGLIAEMEKLARRLIGENIDLVTRQERSLADVKADVSQMEQVIMNLVVNARDAMPSGGTLTIETANVEVDEALAGAHPGLGPGPYVVVRVSDTGVGMDAATRARMFEPFFTTKKEQGTGLGLSTALGIVQQSGGTILVESALGLGTRIEVYLPQSQEVRRDPPSETRRSSLRGNEVVLLVEDEEQVRTLARECLHRNGYRVLEASSPGEALRRSEEHAGPIALLLSDVVMPEMTGYQLAERLLASRPEMRVLYMSGYVEGSRTDRRERRERPVLLSKPLLPDTLLRNVREILDRAPERLAAARQS